MSRTEMRELAFKLIYSLEIQNTYNLEEQVELFLAENNIESENIKDYINDIVCGIVKNISEIESIIKNCLTDKWSIDRISKINLSILKLAIYELKYKE